MSDATPQTLARELARFAAELRAEDIPAAAYARAKLHVLDALGTALAAAGADFADAAARAVCAMGDSGTHGAIGRPERLALRDAMLLNGVLVHGLDFDDTHGASVVHVSASAVPLMLGLGSRSGVNGRDALLAYLLALEIDARLGAVARGTLQKRGWHPTGVIGAFGCAAAAGRLLGADATGIAHALGITLSMASGNLEFLDDGAWTKRLHPGWAAVAGYTAANLGKAGFVGPARPFEGRFGLYRMLLGPAPVDLAPVTAGLGQQWAVDDNGFKPYPACHFLHAFIDCALEIRSQPGFAPGAITHVEALIHPDEVAIVCEPPAVKRAPRNAYDAQFSLPYTVATALCRGQFGLDELDEAALRAPDALALAANVTHAPDAESRYPASYSGALIVTLADGRRLSARQPVNRGAALNPLGGTEVRAKFLRNATRRVSPARAEAIATTVMALDTAPDLHALNALLYPA